MITKIPLDSKNRMGFGLHDGRFFESSGSLVCGVQIHKEDIMKDAIKALEQVAEEIRVEYKRNQQSRWFSPEYAEGLSVSGVIIANKIEELKNVQSHFKTQLPVVRQGESPAQDQGPRV